MNRSHVVVPIAVALTAACSTGFLCSIAMFVYAALGGTQ